MTGYIQYNHIITSHFSTHLPHFGCLALARLSTLPLGTILSIDEILARLELRSPHRSADRVRKREQEPDDWDEIEEEGHRSEPATLHQPRTYKYDAW
jgi:hypothetical protein